MSTSVKYRFATARDCPLLAELNFQLIRDEAHRNRMTVGQLEERMREWLSSEYRAVVFENEHGMVGYALFRPAPEEIHLRQLFVLPHLRRQGFGRAAISILKENIWPRDIRLTVDVLVANTAAMHFWHAVGYRDYALTLEIMPPQRV